MSEIVFEKIATLLSTKKGVNKELVSIDSTFEELGLDSLDSIELIADMEEAFNVTIPNTELQGIKSIRNAVDGLSKALNG
jgi:acyl carrier protein